MAGGGPTAVPLACSTLERFVILARHLIIRHEKADRAQHVLQEFLLMVFSEPLHGLQGQAGFGRLWQYNRTEWPHGLIGCVGSFGLGFMMPGMAYCMSSIISVLYNPDPAFMQQEVGKFVYPSKNSSMKKQSKVSSQLWGGMQNRRPASDALLGFCRKHYSSRMGCKHSLPEQDL